MPERELGRGAKHSMLRQIPLLLGLVLLWMLLWGGFSWMSLITGVVLGLVVVRVFYLPPIELSGRTNWFWLFIFLSRLMLDILRASFIVAGQAFGIGYSRSNAVIAIRLHTSSDLVMTFTGEATSLVPGSFVLDADRDTSTLYLHVFSMRDEAAVERFRQSVYATEERLVLAIGAKEDAERVRRVRRARVRATLQSQSDQLADRRLARRRRRALREETEDGQRPAARDESGAGGTQDG